MYCFNENGQFFNSIINKYFYDLFKLIIICDDYMVVFDWGDKLVKVFFFDGLELVQFFSVLDCDEFFWVCVCYQDMFFVFYFFV